MEDLLSEIDEQETKELYLDQVQDRGITNDDQADFFIRRYKALVDTCCNINDAADRKISDYETKVEAWRESQLKNYQYTLEYIRGMLETYTRTRLEGSKKKSDLSSSSLFMSMMMISFVNISRRSLTEISISSKFRQRLNGESSKRRALSTMTVSSA